MQSLTSRSHQRIACQTPLKFARENEARYYDSQLQNVSAEGMYLELEQPIEAGTRLKIVADDDAFCPDQLGDFKFYQAESRWCREVPGAGHFGVGVKVSDKNQRVVEPNAKMLYLSCDLCGRSFFREKIQDAEELIELCPRCFKGYEGLEAGCCRQLLQRYLLGNVYC